MKTRKVADLAARIDALDRECRDLGRVIAAMTRTPTTNDTVDPAGILRA